MKGVVLAKNKFNSTRFTVLKQYHAGICLYGWEVKSCRLGNTSFKENCYISFSTDGPLLKNFYISPYQHATLSSVDSSRDRRVLFTKQQVSKLTAARQQNSSLTLIPLRLLLVNQKIKLEVGVVKGVKKYEKREKLKQAEWKKGKKFWQ